LERNEGSRVKNQFRIVSRGGSVADKGASEPHNAVTPPSVSSIIVQSAGRNRKALPLLPSSGKGDAKRDGLGEEKRKKKPRKAEATAKPLKPLRAPNWPEPGRGAPRPPSESEREKKNGKGTRKL